MFLDGQFVDAPRPPLAISEIWQRGVHDRGYAFLWRGMACLAREDRGLIEDGGLWPTPEQSRLCLPANHRIPTCWHRSTNAVTLSVLPCSRVWRVEHSAVCAWTMCALQVKLLLRRCKHFILMDYMPALGWMHGVQSTQLQARPTQWYDTSPWPYGTRQNWQAPRRLLHNHGVVNMQHDNVVLQERAQDEGKIGDKHLSLLVRCKVSQDIELVHMDVMYVGTWPSPKGRAAMSTISI